MWLAIVFVAISVMVGLGGATRLTGSGLSMVEWRPLMGWLPPLADAEWERVFGLYQASPQYQTVNGWMDLEAFEQIFWLEYLHRAFGRTIGVVVAVPWLYFLGRRWMTRRLALRTGALLVLGAGQGALGWFMVRSGLVDVPRVSHFRLAAHLLLAFFVAQWVVWIWLDLVVERPKRVSDPRTRALVWGLVALLTVQTAFGAFMAGTRAGWLFATFPDLNGTLWIGPLRTRESLLADILYNPAVIHWTHRALAWGSLAYAVIVALVMRTDRESRTRRVTAWLVLTAVVLQFLLGVATVVTGVALPIAVAHQVGALVTLTLGVALAWQLGPGDGLTSTRSGP